jgi:hypothetical protein
MELRKNKTQFHNNITHYVGIIKDFNHKNYQFDITILLNKN